MSERRVPPPSPNLTNANHRVRGVVVKPKDMKGTLLRLFRLTKGSRQGMGFVLLLSMLTSVTNVLSPYITGLCVTAISDGDPLKWLLLVLIALYVGDWLIRFLQQFIMAKVGQRMIRAIRSALFAHIRKLPLAFFDKRQHGELMSRLTNDVDNISSTISSALTQLLTHIFTITGILFVMLRLSPPLTLVSFAAVALIFTLTKTVTKHTRKLFKEQQVALGELNGHIEESISGLTVVKAFGRENDTQNRFSEKNDRLCDVSTRALIWSGLLMPLTNVINNLSYVAFAVFSALLFVRGVYTEIGMITSFLLYVRQFNRPFVEIANIYNNFQTAVAGAERVFEIMDEIPEPEDAQDALPLRHPKGDVELDHVSFGYDPNRLILKDISVKIKAGTKVAIVGATGSGKTTIINLLTRFYDVTDGSIRLDGHDLREYKTRDLRDAFGVVLQDTALFDETVAENISYGDEDPRRELVEAAARLTGADSFIRRLPNGYDTVLSQGGGELSQGERQLMTIARAVYADAPILILDEATSSVDTVTEQKIRRAMLKISEGRTSFIIAHRLSTICDSDVILLIEDGRIAEMGNHETLMAMNGRYAKLYRTQIGA